MTQSCELVETPIVTLMIAPQVFGAVKVRYVIFPEFVPNTNSPLLPVLSHSKSNDRSAPTPSIEVSWVMKFDQADPVQ